MRYQAAGILCLFLATGAAGQVQQPGIVPGQALIPVDQAVEDQDSIATSLRRIDPGLNVVGEHSPLFKMARPLGSEELEWGQRDTYYRLGPGFRARVDRIDYLVRTGKYEWEINISPVQDGRFIELATLSTIYELTPSVTPPWAPPPVRPTPDYRTQGQVDARIDGRVNGRIDGRLQPLEVPGNGAGVQQSIGQSR